MSLAISGNSWLLSGCGGTDGETANTPIHVVTVLPVSSLTFTPELIADAAGYFDSHGVTVEFEPTRGSAQAMQLLLAKQAPLSRIGQIVLSRHAADNDVPLMVVATLVRRSTIRFVSSVDSPLRTPKDFDGKIFGIPAEGGEAENTLDLCLASHGVDPSSVERQVVGLDASTFELVERGRIAGYAVSLDTATILASSLDNVVVFNPSEFISSGAQVYVASVDSIDRHADQIRAYLASLMQAVRFVIRDADSGFSETLRIMRMNYSFNSLDNDATAKATLSAYVNEWLADGSENLLKTLPTTWSRGYDELVQAGLASRGKDPLRWYTNELLAPM